MGRRLHPPLDSDTGLRLFLKAVGDHPWATMGLLLSYSGLLDWEVEKHYQPLALQSYLLERATIPAPKRAPRRFGLTPVGAAALGRSWSRASLWEALMRVRILDAARLLLAEWVGEANEMIWSVSPFTVQAKAIGSGHPPLRLDGLTCLRFGPNDYVNVAILIDPGAIKLDWFFHQFKGWYACHRRDQFKSVQGVFPTLVVVAANDSRRTQIIQAWHAATPADMSQLCLRVTTFEALVHRAAHRRQWWNERGQDTSLWGGLGIASRPSLRPSCHSSGWPGAMVDDEQMADPAPQPYALPKPKPGLLEWAGCPRQSNVSAATLLRLQMGVSVQQRRLLDRVGEYPIVMPAELANVLDLTTDAIRPAIQELKNYGLLCHPAPDEDGYVLTWRGLAFLAAQIGLRPARYTDLLRWPMRYDIAGKPQYSAEAFLVNREHTRFILDFLTGLRRNGPAHRLELVLWDHVQCAHAFPVTTGRKQGPHSSRVLPDAVGKVRVFGATTVEYVDTDFWLEIDLGTKRGRALQRQLARYYTVGGPRDGLYGRAIRILFVVQRDDEARLQAIRRRLHMLDQRYHTQLDVCLTRRDLLEDERGRLDPTRKVWRTPASSEFVYAFNRWEFNSKGKV